MVRNLGNKAKQKNKDLLYTAVEVSKDFDFCGAVVAIMKADKETAHFSPEYMNLSVNYYNENDRKVCTCTVLPNNSCFIDFYTENEHPSYSVCVDKNREKVTLLSKDGMEKLCNDDPRVELAQKVYRTSKNIKKGYYKGEYLNDMEKTNIVVNRVVNERY